MSSPDVIRVRSIENEMPWMVAHNILSLLYHGDRVIDNMRQIEGSNEFELEINEGIERAIAIGLLFEMDGVEIIKRNKNTS